MKEYRISYYINGVKYECTVIANNRNEAQTIGWEIAEDIWVEEVNE